MIAVAGVSHSYGRVRALRDVTFELSRGEAVGLLGLNGAGKSSLMKIMTGCVFPAAGTVTVDGNDIERHPEEKGKIGYLPETPPLYPEMNVAEYLRHVARLKGLPAAGRAGEVGRVMELLDLGEESGRVILNLSRGCRQRVGLAQALLGDPPLLILDEPTVGLDPAQAEGIRRLIAGLSA